MKIKVKSGAEHLDSITLSKRCGNHLIVNLKEKWKYIDYKQKKNHLVIQVEDGFIDIVFIGEIPRVEFEQEEKDQLIFKVIENEK